MKKHSDNYAFIDAQNLNMGVQAQGWKLDLQKFRRYLQEKYSVNQAYIFIGFVVGNEKLYEFLQKAGYILVFRQTVLGEGGKVKGNVDVDLTVKVFVEFDKFDQAIIVTSDGDFYPLIDVLYAKNKLRGVISPYRKTCSKLLKMAAKEKISYLERLQAKLGLISSKNNKEGASD